MPNGTERTFHHAWRQGGEYAVTVRVYSPGSCVGTKMMSPEESATATLRITVRPALTTSSAPAPVELREFTGGARDDGSGVVDLHAVGEDDDGWVGEATVDWGDGTERTTVRSEHGCTERAQSYPSNSFLRARAEHKYAQPGDYEVTVTFVSTGCDGGGAQEVTSTRTHTAAL